MFLYKKLLNSEYHKNITKEFINREYKEHNNEIYNKLNDIQNKLNNAFNNALLTLELCSQKDPILQKVLRRLNVSIDYKCIAGNILETIVIEYIKEYFNTDNIIKWPNGEMNFPDFKINEIDIDVKSVFVPEESSDNYKFDKNGNKKNTKFNNSIESKQEVIKELYNFFYQPHHKNIGKSFILYVYYACSNEGIKLLNVQIVPLILTINLKKDKSDFLIKSAGTVDENGNKEPKNSSVIIGLKITDNRSLDDIYNDLKLLINN